MPNSTHARPARRVLPAPTGDSMAFWTGGAAGQLLMHRCHTCTRFFHPPAPVCFRCRSRDVGPEPVSGRAEVVSYTVNVHEWYADFPPPYVVAIVGLAEDPSVRLTTNVVGCAVTDVHIGMQVEVVFEEWDDVWIPLFRPTSAAVGTP